MPKHAEMRATGIRTIRRALVAEDDPEMRSLVVDALRGEGFQVDEAGDGRRMWMQTLQDVRYDLVVSDLRLPVVDGLTVLEDVHERAPRVPLILMTAFSDDATRTSAEHLGAVLLEKPFKMAELRAAARRLCEEAAARGTP